MSERSDELDMAAELQEQANVDALARVRTQLTQTHPDFNGVDCIDCGETLPAVRIAYKRVRCTTCQCEVERQEKMRRRA
jgi:NAD-dependent SIR2 family protein deacetylase